MTERYAIYFSPGADSELGQFGQTVLCRSATCERKANASSTFSDQARWLQITEKPTHYGFHATLKAPFDLKRSHTVDSLTAAISEFATSQSPIELTSLFPRELGGFMALTLDNEIESLSSFALNCVGSFESFRKTLSDVDIQRRKLHGLSNRQESLLLQYGYPYVADEFRFHLTLSDRLSEHDQDYRSWVISEYNRLVVKTPVLDQIAIFTQTDRRTPFLQLAKFNLSG
ncbi:MAG: 2'-5' RNA ligase [Granulosicoccus sp.]|jgi:2'-5' RNA ligase